MKWQGTDYSVGYKDLCYVAIGVLVIIIPIFSYQYFIDDPNHQKEIDGYKKLDCKSLKDVILNNKYDTWAISAQGITTIYLVNCK